METDKLGFHTQLCEENTVPLQNQFRPVKGAWSYLEASSAEEIC